MKAWEAAVAVLRETDNPAVMWGDSRLLHAIADRACLATAQRGPRTERSVLNLLSSQPGVLVARKVRGPRGHAVRIFYLPEHAPPEGAESWDDDEVDFADW